MNELISMLCIFIVASAILNISIIVGVCYLGLLAYRKYIKGKYYMSRVRCYIAQKLRGLADVFDQPIPTKKEIDAWVIGSLRYSLIHYRNRRYGPKAYVSVRDLKETFEKYGKFGTLRPLGGWSYGDEYVREWERRNA